MTNAERRADNARLRANEARHRAEIFDSNWRDALLKPQPNYYRAAWFKQRKADERAKHRRYLAVYHAARARAERNGGWTLPY